MNRENQNSGKEFREFFIEELKDIYWAEEHLGKALVKMQKAATSEELAAAFEKHAAETERQKQVVEEVFEALGEKPSAKKCKAMAGLIEEAEELIGDTQKGTYVRDAGLILAGQKVEHYEIATYGTLRIFARYMDEPRIEKLLSGILAGEKKTDVSLTKLAEKFINERAAQE